MRRELTMMKIKVTARRINGDDERGERN